MTAAAAPFGAIVVTVLVALVAGLAIGLLIALRIVVPRAVGDAERAVVSLLHRDELTGLATRRRFVEIVSDRLVARDDAHRETVAAVTRISLDRFKQINDSLGHNAANQVLSAVAARIADATHRSGATAARTGGDEFALIDTAAASVDEALQRAEALLAILRAPIVLPEATIFVTASVGLAAVTPGSGVPAEELIHRADIATHRAKLGGRDRIALFDDSMQAEIAARVDVESALHGAIGRREMRLYHQPIVDITTGRLCGFEALIRWERSPGQVIPPSDFIPVAEEIGLINELGAWALHDALATLRRWTDEGLVGRTATMSVNVSPRQIGDPRFASVVREALVATGTQPSRLWLEITETMMIEEPDLAERTLREIRAMGVRIALDDFGTGYSSLSMLRRFPIERIKIDRAFIHGIADRAYDRSLVRTLVTMAQSMALDLVAEGIETVQQLQSLREIGCDKAQGYLISRPMPPEAIRSTMTAMGEMSGLAIFDAVRQVPTVTAPSPNHPSMRHAF
ncbi:MAG TPA: bifunctional diguanylate cyclase/phosphodiesterase [Ilumatobacter sp.]|nr:bifunctional diguanylate cyclase/phosphodiesterase [Ilumatobacter sp.]